MSACFCNDQDLIQHMLDVRGEGKGGGEEKVCSVFTHACTAQYILHNLKTQLLMVRSVDKMSSIAYI